MIRGRNNSAATTDTRTADDNYTRTPTNNRHEFLQLFLCSWLWSSAFVCVAGFSCCRRHRFSHPRHVKCQLRWLVMQMRGDVFLAERHRRANKSNGLGALHHVVGAPQLEPAMN